VNYPHAEVVSEDGVEAFVKSKGIGLKIRRLRLKRSMGLVELGQRTGLSASYLSQLETGRVVPTLRNLMRVAMVFHVDLSHFFKESKANSFQISKSSDRINLSFGSKIAPFMMSESMSALIPDRTIVPCIAYLRPGMTDQAFEAHPFVGLEFAYVIEGAAQLSTLEKSEILEQADVAWIDGSTKRDYRCVGNVTAAIMIISFPFHS